MWTPSIHIVFNICVSVWVACPGCESCNQLYACIAVLSLQLFMPERTQSKLSHTYSLLRQSRSARALQLSDDVCYFACIGLVDK